VVSPPRRAVPTAIAHPKRRKLWIGPLTWTPTTASVSIR